jgi:hypothetical protein
MFLNFKQWLIDEMAVGTARRLGQWDKFSPPTPDWKPHWHTEYQPELRSGEWGPPEGHTTQWATYGRQGQRRQRHYTTAELARSERKRLGLPEDDYGRIGGDESMDQGWDKASYNILTKTDPDFTKLKNRWRNVKQTFDLYFIKSPEANEHVELGEVTEDYLKNLGIEAPPINKGNITVFFTNAFADEPIPMTPWTVGHRFAHALDKSKVGYEEFSKRVQKDFESIANLVGNLPDAADWGDDPGQGVILKIMSAFGAMRSARKGMLGRTDEPSIADGGLIRPGQTAIRQDKGKDYDYKGPDPSSVKDTLANPYKDFPGGDEDKFAKDLPSGYSTLPTHQKKYSYNQSRGQSEFVHELMGQFILTGAITFREDKELSRMLKQAGRLSGSGFRSSRYLSKMAKDYNEMCDKILNNCIGKIFIV